jgi:predicted tellurium resistance membrane protein TerC
MVDEITIMITAIVIAIIVMILGATAISEYVRAHPTMKTLALAFLLMVGVALIAEAFHLHIPRGYVYFAMAFSVGVELVNMRVLAARRAARGES